VHSVCQTTYAQDIVFDFWLLAFVGSKFAELFDTIFIVLRRRPLTFLHCYHHFTVLIYCWHGGKELTAAGRWFCWMNYGVHCFTYAYFAAKSAGFQVPRPIAISVTTVQMTQMAAGICIVYTVHQTKSAAWHAGEDADLACHQSWDNLYFGFAIYFTYFLLFLRFFAGAYIWRPKEKVNEANPEEEMHKKINNNSIGASQSDGEKCPVCENENDDSKSEIRLRRGWLKNGAQNRQPQSILEKYCADKPHICRQDFAYSTTHG